VIDTEARGDEGAAGEDRRRRRGRLGRRDRLRLRALGTETLLFEALERVLPTEDADISKASSEGCKKQGMTIHTGTLVEGVEAGEKS
jgi:NADH dehydrogenase FAD-containing subunit